MKKITGSGERLGLLEREEADDLFRPGANAAFSNISEPNLDNRVPAEPVESFLRSNQQIPVRRRRGSRFKSRFAFSNRWQKWALATAALLVLGVLAALVLGTKSMFLHSTRFRLNSMQDVQVGGTRVVSAPAVLAVFAPDVGHSVFRIPLTQREAELERIPWVRLATVMRLWPNRLRVSIVERTPVAFVRDGNIVRLVDDQGVLLPLPDAVSQHYSFPVLTGISASDPAVTREAKVQRYVQFSKALDTGGDHVSNTLSEVDLTDPADIRAVFAADFRQPVVHFGDSDFLARYLAYRAHLSEWLQQYPKLRSVDMRYGKQVVLDTGSTPQAPNVPLQLPGAVAAGAAASSAVTATAPAKGTALLAKYSSIHGEHPAHRVAQSLGHKRSSKRTTARGHVVRHPLMRIVKGL